MDLGKLCVCSETWAQRACPGLRQIGMRGEQGKIIEGLLDAAYVERLVNGHNKSATCCAKDLAMVCRNVQDRRGRRKGKVGVRLTPNSVVRGGEYPYSLSFLPASAYVAVAGCCLLA